MTSLQLQAGLKIELSGLELSVIGETLKGALDFLAKNDEEDASAKQVTKVTGNMRNVQGRPVKLEKSHEWFGCYVCPPSSTIGGGASGAFLQRANPVIPDIPHAGPPSNVGCKAMVIYGTYDKALPQLGYLLAWYKSETTTEHKVYVEAGDLSKLMKQELCEIERKLDLSCSKSRYVDKVTGATAVAEIKNENGSVASLGACFNVIRN